MNPPRPNLSRQLLDLDPQDAPADRDHARRMQALFERKLSSADWARLALMGLGGIAGAVLCGSLALTEPAGVPTRTRVALAVMALLGLSWAALAGLIVRRGSVHSGVHGTAAAAMGLAYALLATAAVGVLSAAGPPRPMPPGLVLLPIAALALATVVFIVHQLRQSELRLRRDLLQIEYRLARQGEAGGGKGDAA